MITRFKSIKSIIAGLYRDLGVNTEINEQDIVEWCAESLSMIGSYSQMEEVGVILEISNHSVKLPINFVYLKDINYNGKPLSWSSKSAANNYNCPECNQIPTCCTDYNFYIQDGYLNSSLKEGKLCLTYLSIPIDEEGYPLVPDDVYFDKALKSYCTYMLDKIQFRKGLLPDAIYKESKQDWLFYVNSARGSANMPDASKLDKIQKIWVRLIPKPHSYSNNFRNLENHERRNLR